MGGVGGGRGRLEALILLEMSGTAIARKMINDFSLLSRSLSLSAEDMNIDYTFFCVRAPRSSLFNLSV